VTRGELPQRAGSLGLNGGGPAAAVPPDRRGWKIHKESAYSKLILISRKVMILY